MRNPHLLAVMYRLAQTAIPAGLLCISIPSCTAPPADDLATTRQAVDVASDDPAAPDQPTASDPTGDPSRPVDGDDNDASAQELNDELATTDADL